MDCESDRSVVLLAVKPEYVEAILDGRKTVEFRRRPFGRPPSHLVLYACSPTMGVLGYCEVEFIDHAAPGTLWRRYGEKGSIEYPDFKEYYSSCPSGIAIGVKGVRMLKQAVALSSLAKGMTAPQSFRYLTENQFAKLASR